jgi:anthranilate phosphoribosyltransferase
MGLALAEAAARRGHAVTLLLGPIPMSDAELAAALQRSGGATPVRVRRFSSSADLEALLREEWPVHDLLLMAAAVSDHRPRLDPQRLQREGGKLQREEGPLRLELDPTPDLLESLAAITRADQLAIGFALEPRARLETSALNKLRRKALGGIVANPLEAMDAPTIEGTLLLADGRRLIPPEGACEKTRFAEWLLEQLEQLHPAARARRSEVAVGAEPPPQPLIAPSIDAEHSGRSPQPGPPEFPGEPRPGDITGALAILLRGEPLDASTARGAFRSIMSGSAHEAEIAALLALLATRLPTVEELVGAAGAMRERVDPVPTALPGERLLDTAGTGGAPKTFNVSTAAAIVAAAAGAKVAKHGNRSRTGRGSAEVLTALGVNVDASRVIQARCLDELGICFCFAIHHHPAAKHAMPVRKALAFPTIFNLLGPLTNPAGARRQLMGVYDRRFVRPIAEALAKLGAVRALVVHSEDGLDELSLGARTLVADVEQGAVREYFVDPRRLGLLQASSESLAARDLDHAAHLVRGVLSGEVRGPHREMTLLSAAAALVAGGVAGDLEEGIALAGAAIESGQSRRTLERLAELSRF